MPKPRILMCPPTHFGVDYVINPWMRDHVGAADSARAEAQWQALRARLDAVAATVLVLPAAGQPDMPFTANAGLAHAGRFIPSRFRHAERRGESGPYAHWALGAGFDVLPLPDGIHFEGAGDALFDRGGDALLWFGHGHRSDAEAAEAIAIRLDVEVVPLRLADPRFYHLDTCFCPLAGGWLLYYPPAFDDHAREAIERRVPASRRIAVEEADALAFACNAVNVGSSVVLHPVGAALRERLAEAGFDVQETPLDEFHKAGGSAKCLTLLLDEPPG